MAEDSSYGGAYVAYIICGVIIICENVILVYTIIRDSSLHTAGSFLVASLGVSDIIVGIVATTSGILRIPGVQVPSTILTVQLMFSIGLVCLSAVHMPVIAFERWLYLSRPFIYAVRVTKKVLMRVIIAMWVSLIIYIATMSVIETHYFGNWPSVLMHVSTLVKCVSVALFYITGISVTCFFYASIMIVARQQQKKVRVYHPNKIKRCGKKIALYLTVFAVYLSMNTMPIVALVVDIFIPVPTIIFTISLPLDYLNSGCNFCILLIMDLKFRTACKRIFGFRPRDSDRIFSRDTNCPG